MNYGTVLSPIPMWGHDRLGIPGMLSGNGILSDSDKIPINKMKKYV